MLKDVRSEVNMSDKQNLYSRSATLSTRTKNVQLLFGSGSPTVDTRLNAEERDIDIHEALREIKRLAISAKDKYEKDHKKKPQSSPAYVYDCQTLIQTSIPILKQLLGIYTLEEERTREQVLAEEESFHNGTNRDFKKWNQAFEGKKTYEDEIKNLKNEVDILQQEKDAILRRLKEMEKQVASLKEEKGTLLKRLSEVAGARLGDNNPGISDLSDPNRPLKLNEKMSELNDNEERKLLWKQPQLLQIGEEGRHREKAKAQRENDRRETQREFRSFNKDYNQKRNRLDEVAAIKNKHKNKHEDKFVRQFRYAVRQEEEIDEKELHNVLRMIKTLAVIAKQDFKKKKVYRYYCEEMIDRWIPDLKRLLRIRSREERRHREEADAQRENDRRETQRELRNFSKGYDNKRNLTDEVAALKNKHKDELVRQKKNKDDAMTALKREHQKEMDRLLAEKEKLLTRLSQTAGDKLRENNPNFSDLSDPYRPTKLAEMFSELYDNQWTDAMEILEADRQEKRAVETLLNILMKCFELCKKSSESQLSSLRDACCGNVKNDKDNDLVKSAKKAKEMRREMATWTLNESRIYHALWEKLEESFGKDDVGKYKLYIQKCVQCCWFMCVQDPALQLTVWTIGTKMDGYNMRSFTKNGQYVDFSVWPALYLHKDGPLLSKGIVQGTNQATV